MQVVIPSTPASYFHALRRQIHRKFRKPVIFFMPKAMLKVGLSTVDDLTGDTQFQPVIDDLQARALRPSAGAALQRQGLPQPGTGPDMEPDANHKLVPPKQKLTDVAIVRVEQPYPFPAKEISAVLAKYRTARQVVWVQEEPRNRGCWTFMDSRLRDLLPAGTTLTYAGRDEAASPATGSHKMHEVEEEEILSAALGLPAHQPAVVAVAATAPATARRGRRVAVSRRTLPNPRARRASHDARRRRSRPENAMLVLVAELTVKPGLESAFERTMTAAVPQVRTEPGNHHYGFHRSKDDPRLFLFYRAVRRPRRVRGSHGPSQGDGHRPDVVLPGRAEAAILRPDRVSRLGVAGGFRPLPTNPGRTPGSRGPRRCPDGRSVAAGPSCDASTPVPSRDRLATPYRRGRAARRTRRRPARGATGFHISSESDQRRRGGSVRLADTLLSGSDCSGLGPCHGGAVEGDI